MLRLQTLHESPKCSVQLLRCLAIDLHRTSEVCSGFSRTLAEAPCCMIPLRITQMATALRCSSSAGENLPTVQTLVSLPTTCIFAELANVIDAAKAAENCWCRHFWEKKA